METGLVARPTNGELVLSQRGSIPTEHEMMVYHTMAEQAVTSKMYGNNFKDKSAVMMIMLSARELGIPPMQALNGGINIISGKVEISARMMSALIRKSGHKIKVVESNETHCKVIGTRCDTGEVQEASFSLAEAQKAGLVKPGGGWVKWPKDMCFARALSRLARQLFSDVIGIGYVEGEINAIEVKPSNSQEVLSDDFVPQDETIVENEAEFVQKFLDLFDREERHQAIEYLKVVQKHFDWTEIQTIKELLKDEKRLFDKFNAWKNKQKKVEEV